MPREAMTAELIERAKTIATQRRDDAEKATPGPWVANSRTDDRKTGEGHDIGGNVRETNGRKSGEFVGRTWGWGPLQENAQHIANHDPAAMVPLWTWALDFFERHKAETEPEFYYAECKTCDPDDECEGHEVQICSYCWAPSDDGYAGQVLYPCSELKSLARVIVGQP